MDTTLDRIGLYDLFGTFLSGAIISQLFCYLTTIFLSSEASIAIFQTELSSLSLNALSAVTFSFLVGLVLESCASLMDKKFFHFRDKAMDLIDSAPDKVLSVDISSANLDAMKQSILGNTFPQSDPEAKRKGEYIYQQCKIYLEANKLNAREQSINAIYVLTRNVMVGFGFCMVLYLAIQFLNYRFTASLHPAPAFSLAVIVLFGFCIAVLWNRCTSYSRYRVRVILREYYHHKFAAEASSSH